jgi:glyoxylase-like metal-dependent hydrolase (beta-lactamase superfamily II)
MAAPNTLTRVSEHVYAFSPDSATDRPSLAAVVGAKGALLLDAGNSPAHLTLFLDALRAERVPTPRLIALTHWHWDHTFGASGVDVPLIAHRETARQLAIQATYEWSDAALDERVDSGLETAFCRDMLKLEWPDRANLHIRLPDVLFDDSLAIDLGDVTCEIRHVGGDHADDSAVMYIPQDRVLFLGDCLYDAIYAPVRHYTTAKLFPLIDRLAMFHADYAIAGHHPDVLSGAELGAWMSDLKRIGAVVDSLGANREGIIAELRGTLSEEGALEDVDAFIAGL